MAKYFLKKLSFFTSVTLDEIWTVVLILVAIKISLATIVTVMIFVLEKDHYNQWQEKLIKKSTKKRAHLNDQFEPTGLKTAGTKALRDLINPLFIFTWLFTAIFFYFAKSDLSSLIWILCRLSLLAIYYF